MKKSFAINWNVFTFTSAKTNTTGSHIPAFKQAFLLNALPHIMAIFLITGFGL